MGAGSSRGDTWGQLPTACRGPGKAALAARPLARVAAGRGRLSLTAVGRGWSHRALDPREPRPQVGGQQVDPSSGRTGDGGEEQVLKKNTFHCEHKGAVAHLCPWRV